MTCRLGNVGFRIRRYQPLTTLRTYVPQAWPFLSHVMWLRTLPLLLLLLLNAPCHSHSENGSSSTSDVGPADSPTCEEELGPIALAQLTGGAARAHMLLLGVVEAQPACVKAWMKLGDSHLRTAQEPQAAARAYRRALTLDAAEAVRLGVVDRWERLDKAAAGAAPATQFVELPPSSSRQGGGDAAQQECAWADESVLGWPVPLWDTLVSLRNTSNLLEAVIAYTDTHGSPVHVPSAAESSAEQQQQPPMAIMNAYVTSVLEAASAHMGVSTSAPETDQHANVQAASVLSATVSVDGHYNGYMHAPPAPPAKHPSHTVLRCVHVLSASVQRQPEPELSLKDPRTQAFPLGLSEWQQVSVPFRTDLTQDRLLCFPAQLDCTLQPNLLSAPRVLAWFTVSMPSASLGVPVALSELQLGDPQV